jgi:FAD:protein FMN transferase
MKIFYIAVAGLVISLAACTSRKQHEVRLWGEAQGSTYSIVYIDEQQRNFQNKVEDIFRNIDLSMSTWLDNSIISAVNRGESPDLDEYFVAVMKRSLEIYKDTDGHFDVTVAPLVNAWGFGRKAGLDSLPQVTIDSLLLIIGSDKVRLEGNQLILEKPSMKIDFNAIAQGYTVDVIAEMFEENGILDYMVEVGGEIRTSGVNVNKKPWRIGIDKPVESTEKRQLQAILKLSGKSLATSGSYRKYRIQDGVKYSHAIHPKTGLPVRHTLLSVSVIARDCISADAYATAFLVMGLEASLEYLKERGDMEAFFISDDGQGNLVEQMTSGFGDYIMEDAFQ